MGLQMKSPKRIALLSAAVPMIASRVAEPEPAFTRGTPWHKKSNADVTRINDAEAKRLRKQEKNRRA
jgi:hypothetical protein